MLRFPGFDCSISDANAIRGAVTQSVVELVNGIYPATVSVAHVSSVDYYCGSLTSYVSFAYADSRQAERIDMAMSDPAAVQNYYSGSDNIWTRLFGRMDDVLVVPADVPPTDVSIAPAVAPPDDLPFAPTVVPLVSPTLLPPPFPDNESPDQETSVALAVAAEPATTRPPDQPKANVAAPPVNAAEEQSGSAFGPPDMQPRQVVAKGSSPEATPQHQLASLYPPQASSSLPKHPQAPPEAYSPTPQALLVNTTLPEIPQPLVETLGTTVTTLTAVAATVSTATATATSVATSAAVAIASAATAAAATAATTGGTVMTVAVAGASGMEKVAPMMARQMVQSAASAAGVASNAATKAGVAGAEIAGRQAIQISSGRAPPGMQYSFDQLQAMASTCAMAPIDMRSYRGIFGSMEWTIQMPLPFWQYFGKLPLTCGCREPTASLQFSAVYEPFASLLQALTSSKAPEMQPPRKLTTTTRT
jgi:hypothetical protein